MADQVGCCIVQIIVEQLGDPIGRQFGYFFCYNRNVEELDSRIPNLKNTQVGLQMLIDDAERNGNDILPAVIERMADFNLITRKSCQFFDEEGKISKTCFKGPLNPKVRYQRSRKAKKMTVKVDQLIRDSNFPVIACPPPPLPIGSMLNEDDIDFESRKPIFEEVLELLRGDQVNMIGLWGMGGVGKTTFVKKVAERARNRDEARNFFQEGQNYLHEESSMSRNGFHFDEVVMGTISQSPDLRSIQSQIAYSLGLTLNETSEEGRASRIFQRLQAKKKILIILDNIWERLELNRIGIPFGGQHKGCKIIFTTRILDVCDEMRTQKNFQIGLLPESEALSLFQRMAGNYDKFSEKGRLAMKLTKECGGLPIAIAIVATGLINKSLDYWTDVAHQLQKSEPDKKLCDTITLSYNYLYPEDAKSFFLLCSLFPEDYDIPIQLLCEYGVGLNLFRNVDNVYEALVRADRLASYLKSSSLLLDGRDKKLVKMHDVVRDVALSIASEGKNNYLVRTDAGCREWREKTAIALWFNDNQQLPDALECSQLQILMISCRNHALNIPENVFLGMSNLIVLDMSGMDFLQLPESLGSLVNLHTLRLSYCKLGDISMVGKLKNLVVLSFCGSNLKVLPEKVGELTNLTLLDLTDCGGLKVIIPGVFEKLSHLEALYIGESFYQWEAETEPLKRNASLAELPPMSRLKVLEICIPDITSLPDNLHFMNLSRFKVSIGDDDLGRKNIHCSASKILKLKGVRNISHAGVNMLIKKAEHLDLIDNGLQDVLLPNLHADGFLKELIVRDCDHVECILNTGHWNSDNEFPSLRQLYLLGLVNLKEICHGQLPSRLVNELDTLWLNNLPSLVYLWQDPTRCLTLSNLTVLKVEECGKLQYVFTQTMAKSLLNLKELVIKSCEGMEVIFLSEVEISREDIIIFPKLSSLCLGPFWDLKGFYSNFTGEETLLKQVFIKALEKLDIKGIGRMTRIWDSSQLDGNSFCQLKSLHLISCHSLYEIFPLNIILSLQSLEDVWIEKCSSVEKLFGSDCFDVETVKMQVLCPRLKNLTLLDLPKLMQILWLTTDYLSQMKVVFPVLESLHIKNLTSMQEICHNDIPAGSFCELQTLHVTGCNELLKVFPSQLIPSLRCLKEIFVDHCSSLKSVFTLDCRYHNQENTMALFPELQRLDLAYLPNLMQIWAVDDLFLSVVQVQVPSLDTMRLIQLPKLNEIMHPKLLPWFPKLKILHVERSANIISYGLPHIIQGLEGLEELLIQDDYPVTSLQAIATLPSLRRLSFRNMHCLQKIQWYEGCHQTSRFQNLCSLFITNCKGLRSLFTPLVVSSLSQLQELLIFSCDDIESIVEEENDEQISTETVTFSKLHFLRLDNLPRLTSFYTGRRTIKWPFLEALSIMKCHKMQTFTSNCQEVLNNTNQRTLFDQEEALKTLEHLTLCNLSVDKIWHDDLPASSVGKLQKLKVDRCEELLKVIPPNLVPGLQKLRVLGISNCVLLEHVYSPKEYPSAVFPLLEELTLTDLPKLKQLWWNISESFDFPNLCRLEVRTCNDLITLFTPSAANRLVNLRKLFIENCSKMEAVISREGEEECKTHIVFPLVDTLHLHTLPNLKLFYMGNYTLEWPQLEYVVMYGCKNMESFSSGTLKMPKLKSIARISRERQILRISQ